jgi:hypothetical protein
MISTGLQGGLGNQMFQIAVAYSLAKENDDEFGFNFDTCNTPNQGKPSNFYKNTIFKKIPTFTNYNFNNFYREPSFSFKKIPYIENLYLDGYFQSEKYFINYKDEIKNLFVLDEEYSKSFFNSLPKDSTYTSIHIRRGDYVHGNYNFHFTCDIDYFKNVISFLEDTKFIIFSDDLEWAKDNFNGDNFIYPNINDDVKEMSVMSNCHNNIISNSTFGWWGAYLNSNVNKKVIAPKRWFNFAGPQDYQDVVPSEWITIDN